MSLGVKKAGSPLAARPPPKTGHCNQMSCLSHWGLIMVTACRLWPLLKSGAGAELGSWVRNGNNEAIAAVESAHVRQAERRW